MRPGIFASFSLCISGALLVSGCGMESGDWVKPGATQAQLHRDLADCEREATGPGPFNFRALNQDYVTARDQIRRARESCMIAHGWQWRGDGQVDGGRQPGESLLLQQHIHDRSRAAPRVFTIG